MALRFSVLDCSTARFSTLSARASTSLRLSSSWICRQVRKTCVQADSGSG